MGVAVMKAGAPQRDYLGTAVRPLSAPPPDENPPDDTVASPDAEPLDPEDEDGVELLEVSVASRGRTCV